MNIAPFTISIFAALGVLLLLIIVRSFEFSQILP